MRFYATRTEAIQKTYSALQLLNQRRKGSLNPSRAIRVATLYGHLQCRADPGGCVQLALRELATAWHLQPRLLREDLADLQAIGWLTYSGDAFGTQVQLLEVVEPQAHNLELLQGTREQAGQTSADAPSSEQELAQLLPLQAEPSGREPSPEPSVAPESTPPQSKLIAQFAAIYNQHKPGSWPTYTPTGTVLGSRLRQAIRHAGGAEAFEAALIQALRGMPEFWRTEYPIDRNGSDCARALLQVDRASEGRGVEHWHVFAWGAYTGRPSCGIGGNTPGVGHHRPAATYHPEHRRACELLAWDGHQWTGRGMEAASLPASELQRLAEILEAAGFGKPGTAAEQFAQEARC
ncbi:hypothetical protein KUL97_08385 [Synechococcus sp. HK05]|uniref:hypothetical protein n=1 Tax=Synechococcus sp. HK05 TaxID=2725975 RepID=UPI001C388F92|nr:hypothetical protein [Synechococcus sp. HK05]MBV2351721.1 hypothetical protein [Synechococcus sp. HK05]